MNDSGQAARLMELLGLSEDELCRVLDADPLTVVSGQLEHRPELSILLDLLAEPAADAGPAVLQRWVRAAGPAGRPIDALLARDFAAFEDALSELSAHGFVLRGEGQPAVGESFEYTLRVRYGECDVQGIVFNAHYLAYFDVSMTELWRAAYGGYQVMLDRGIDMVLAEANLRYLSPARFDEELKLGVSVARLGTTSVLTRHHVWRGLELLVEGSLRHVFIDRETLTKVPIPDWASDGLAPWVVETD